MRKTPIDLNASTRSSGMRRPVSISAAREVTWGTNSRISASKTLGCLSHRSALRRSGCRRVSTFANEVTVVTVGSAEGSLATFQCSETYSRTYQFASIRSRLDWGSYWGSSMSSKDQFAALEVMSRARAALGPPTNRLDATAPPKVPVVIPHRFERTCSTGTPRKIGMRQ